MSNVIYLRSAPDSQQTKESTISYRKLAKVLLLKLNQDKVGDIATILEPNEDLSDIDSVIHWLKSNQERFDNPLGVSQCYEYLCYELNERIDTV